MLVLFSECDAYAADVRCTISRLFSSSSGEHACDSSSKFVHHPNGQLEHYLALCRLHEPGLFNLIGQTALSVDNSVIVANDDDVTWKMPGSFEGKTSRFSRLETLSDLGAKINELVWRSIKMDATLFT